MKPTIIVAGYGPGISDAVARRFGGEGFSIALLARTRERLDAGVAALTASGITAAAFPTQLTDEASLKDSIAKVRATLGKVAVLHWNAYSNEAGDLTKATAAEVRAVLDVGVTGLIITVRELLVDLQSAEKPAVLVTGGGLSAYDDDVDAKSVEWGVMGLAVSKAAQHKTVGLLSAKLAKAGIYVGEVVVQGVVKGTAFDAGNGSLDPNEIANRFWDLYTQRTVRSVDFG